MKVYGSPALKGNAEVGEAALDKRGVPAFAPVPPRQPPTDPLPAVGPSGRGFDYFPGLPEGPSATKGKGMFLGYLFLVSQFNLSALEESGLYDSLQCVTSEVCSCR